ncbi:serine/threonine-protein kinase [Galbitalea sp. SE-J8]|uniref:serine/threonine-protein kinase n=1 Tax=Galbitalea sp. SE-J8 TaxID=3054952 RepID=UPI00259CDC10|nr:serine/threonine-protein kinase [Galbitalea sp. SE-J8]MDM4763476.1 serine/threonine-protein kinase [Galbitalea sp. SE-J8]
MARRLPSQPPALPGFSYVRVLGSGGFADVFLYEQNMPRRQVAVKVLLSEVVNDGVRQMFQAEANLMAQLSAHPSILTVYQASVSSDGRPYLVMELCSSSLATRYRSELLPVAEVLRIGVKIGSAIETAHRAGVLHRDLKPSNILMTAYGHPVLADFGIAATLAEVDSQEAVGLSIPWSAPEVLMDESAGTVRSEVWAFAATVYSLLAGRSPFEAPGGDNTSGALIGRINRAKPHPVDRPDAPESLERALARGLARAPRDRPASVLELVRELQAVEAELGLAPTSIEVAMDDWALATASDLADRTVVRGLPREVTPAGANGRRRRRRGAAPAALDASGSRSDRRVTGSSLGRPSSRGAQALAWVLVAVAVVLIAVGATVGVLLLRSDRGEVPVVSDIAARVADGSIEFSWRDPGLDAGDQYQIRTADGATSAQTVPRFVVEAPPGDEVCVTVTVVHDGRPGAPSGSKCATVPG